MKSHSLESDVHAREPDGASRSSRRGLVLRVTFTIALLAVLATQLDFREMGGVFAGLHWGLLAIALALAFVDRVLATLRWWILLRVRDVPVRFGPLLVLHLHASFLGGFMPTSFSVDAVRIYLSARATGRTVDCIASSVVDRLMMMICTFAVAVPMALLLAETLLPVEARWLIIGSLVLAIGSIVAFIMVSRTRAGAATGALAERVFGERLAAKLATLYWAIHAFHRRPTVLLAGVGITTIMLVVRLLFMLVLAWAARAEPLVLELIIVTPVIWVVLMAPVSIGGFGLQEVMYAAFLSAAGIAATVAVTMSLVEHVLVRGVSLPGALFWSISGYEKSQAHAPGDAAGAEAARAVPTLQR